MWGYVAWEIRQITEADHISLSLSVQMLIM